MMHTDGRALVVARHGRAIVLQPLTDVERYKALLTLGCRESVAAGVVANLITTKVKVA